jgi:TonB family protein
VGALGKPGGATDLGEAIRRASTLLSRRDASRRRRVIYVGDGIPSVGELETGRLVGVVRRHLEPLRARLTTVGVGSDVDGVLLAALARSGSGSYVAYAPGATAWGQALQVLARQGGVTLDRVEVSLPEGVTRVAPRQIATLHQGDELVLAGRAGGRIKGDVVVKGRVNGEPFRASFPVDARMKSSGGNAFVPRVWAQLTIDDLAASGAPGDRATVVALSKRHHLLTRHTSLLVLESEAMRRAFGVQRGPRPTTSWTGEDAAEDANVAGETGQAQQARAEVRGLVARAKGTRRAHGYYANPGSDEDPLGGLAFDGQAGERSRKRSERVDRDLDALIDRAVRPGRHSLGTTRREGGGGGDGDRRGREKGWSGPKDRVPRVTAQHRAAVSGSLSQNQIRSVVRRQIRSIRRVYETQLKRNPNLRGMLRVRFTIGPTGRVIAVSLPRSTLKNPQLERGIASVVKRWRFPAPKGGGVIHVEYPFVFRSSGATSEKSRPVDLPPLGRGRRWIRMKRVWYRDATLTRLTRPTWRDLHLVGRREQDLAERPDSRDRHRQLYGALIRAGRLERSIRLLEDWLRREPRSPEALSLLAEAASRAGQRQRALRALESIIDLDPRNATLHRRLTQKLQATGQTRAACAHRVSLAALAPADPRLAQQARDCRDGYRPAWPERTRVRGRVTLRATWLGDQDLDLALVTRRGRRITWLSNRRGLDFASVNSSLGEELGVRWLPVGRYRIEVTRADGSVAASPVRGSVSISAPGLRRRVPFVLGGKQTYLAELRIRRRSRLVPAP